MHKLLILLIISVWMQPHLFAQQKLSWTDLNDVSFHDIYSAKYGEYFMKPTFGDMIKSYEGTKVRVKGFFLDFSYDDQAFHMISKNPMSSCFFCGGAGPETIVEVVFEQKPPFKTDQVVEVTGILELNVDDVEHCNYILKNATGKLIN